MVRVVIAEAHPATRRALVLLLALEHDVEVVGEVATAADAGRVMRATDADALVLGDRLIPDSLALGRLPDHSRIVVVGMEDDPGFARRAMLVGASAYVLGDRADADLAHAITAAVPHAA